MEKKINIIGCVTRLFPKERVTMSFVFNDSITDREIKNEIKKQIEATMKCRVDDKDKSEHHVFASYRVMNSTYNTSAEGSIPFVYCGGVAECLANNE